MKVININERIRQIKDHIGRASLKAAFEDLEDLIRSIDGMEVENHDEREFFNQLTIIKARFNSFNDSVITDVGAQKTELNQITSSLLTLTDNVHELLINNPDLIIPTTPEEITANLAIPIETIATTHPIMPPSKGEDNSGCLFSFSKSADQTNVNVQANWLKIFGGLALFILAVALGLKLIFGLGGAETPPRVVLPPEPIPNITTPPKPESKIITKSLNLRFPSNSSDPIKEMVNMINSGKSTGRDRIVFANILFEKNQVKLNARAKKELDNMAIILKQVPDQQIMLSATVGPDESTSYRGSKEITLGDIRAREMINYLKSKGVLITQMEFEGGGVSDSQKVMMEIY